MLLLWRKRRRVKAKAGRCLSWNTQLGGTIQGQGRRGRKRGGEREGEDGQPMELVEGAGKELKETLE